MAVYGFKGLGWLLCGVVVAPSCYLVTSQVASERSRVEAVRSAIADARRDIRDLDVELKTRANLAQLERWNTDLLALSAPTAAQYFDAGATGVAQLDNGRGDAVVQYAAYDFADGPAITRRAADGDDSGEAAPVMQQAVVTRAASDDGRSAGDEQHTKPARLQIASAERRDGGMQPVAMLDQKLLSDATLGDLARGARLEAAVLR